MSNYEKCNGCPYYYGEIDSCMFGEEDVPELKLIGLGTMQEAKNKDVRKLHF